MAHNVTSEQDYYNIIKNNRCVVADVHASWCSPCQKLAPKIDELATQFPNIAVCKVDYDQFPQIVEAEEIVKLPTLKFFFDGEVINTIVGTELPSIKLSFEVLSLKNPVANLKPIASALAGEIPGIKPKFNPLIPNQQQQEAMGAQCRGSSKYSTDHSQPPELIEFIDSLTTPHTIVLFSNFLPVENPHAPKQVDFFTNRPLDIAAQTIKDINTLIERFSSPGLPIDFKHVLIDPNDQKSIVLAEEYGCDRPQDCPVIKLMWKKIVYASFKQGSTLEVENKMNDFVQLGL